MRAVLSLGVAVLIASLQQPSAAASDNGEWSLKPAMAEGTTSSRMFFDHAVSPGHAVADLATLANLTDESLTFNLYAADAYTTSDGGFALRLEDDPRSGVGSWVSLTTNTITVDAKSAVTFPIQIGVPADASPGDWAGGIVASVATPADASKGPPGLLIERGVAARIYVRVSGALDPELAVEDLKLDLEPMGWAPAGHPAAALVSYDIANMGNTRLSGKAHLEIQDALGRTVQSFPDQMFTDLLPRERIRITETWTGMPLTGFRYKARVVATADAVSAASASPGTWHLPVPFLLVLIPLVLLVARSARHRRVLHRLHRERLEPVRS